MLLNCNNLKKKNSWRTFSLLYLFCFCFFICQRKKNSWRIFFLYFISSVYLFLYLLISSYIYLFIFSFFLQFSQQSMSRSYLLWQQSGFINGNTEIQIINDWNHISHIFSLPSRCLNTLKLQSSLKRWWDFLLNEEQN